MATKRQKRQRRTSKKIHQVGCAKRVGRRLNIKGGAVGTMFSQEPIIFSKTVFPLETTGGSPFPADGRQPTGGSRKKQRYSRKYYKQSGGALNFSAYSVGPTDHSNQPINTMYSATNRFQV